MPLRIPSTLTVCTLGLCLCTQASNAQTSTASADSAFRKSDWASAASAYEQIATKDTTNGQAWFRLGFSYQSLGQYSKALGAFTRAKALGFQPVSVRYRLGRVYAKLNDANHAFELLDSAVAMAPGNFTPQQLDAEQDLAGLRSDARYAKLSSALAAARYPCRTQKEFQQFDFWIGQWDVTPWAGVAAPGQPPGFNDVHPILEKCIVFENWKGPGGGEGKSFNYYDTNLASGGRYGWPTMEALSITRENFATARCALRGGHSMHEDNVLNRS